MTGLGILLDPATRLTSEAVIRTECGRALAAVPRHDLGRGTTLIRGATPDEDTEEAVEPFRGDDMEEVFRRGEELAETERLLDLELAEGAAPRSQP